MRKHLYIIPFVFIVLIAINLTSCKKEILLSKNNLSFSADTVLFDTVFTTVSSTTKRLKIYNKDNKPIKINSVVLQGGKNSPYRINLDGISDTKFKNITIPANDSLYMFVEVTLGENNYDDPLIIVDSVLFETNGKDQYLQLAAWGQDAHFYNNEYVNGIWTADKPHVIYNLAIVPPGENLTIEAGARIYLHKGAMLAIDSSSLNIQGTFEDKVIFQGDRLEPFYQDVKGQYYGIYFSKALPSTIDNAIIKNGTAGIHVFDEHPDNTDYTLTISNTEIYNHASYGIFNYSGGKIKGENLSVHNNGMYAYFLLEGGAHNFRHCNFLSYGSDGNQPAVALKNYFTRNDGYTYLGDISENAFYNSIIYGGGEYQIGIDTMSNNGMVSFHFDFNTNFIRQKEYPEEGNEFSNNTWNESPKFKSLAEKDYHLKSSSPCIEAGNQGFATNTDIEGTMRDPFAPDIGAYEHE